MKRLKSISLEYASSSKRTLGMGELHLDIIVDRLRREFKVDVNQGQPHVMAARKNPMLTSAYFGKSWVLGNDFVIVDNRDA